MKRIMQYLKDKHHDRLREEKLIFWQIFRVKDKGFDYKKHLKGSFWDYLTGNINK